ncbi:MAG: hemerythrin domain-containing protein [Fidelibacterota bacterium]
MTEQLPRDHLLTTLMREHREIVKLLDRLRQLTAKLEAVVSPDESPTLLDQLSDVIENLLAVELHHDREEKVLFPALEKRGITDSPYVLREEHQILRDMKTKFLKTVRRAKRKDFPLVKARLGYYGRSIDRLIRKHIEMENSTLFPAALKAIQNDADWEELNRDSRNLES